MQRKKDEKRRQIIAASARLFATRRFDEVRLDDVASVARVGKGTLYVYFRGKDDLYLALIRDGFEEMVGAIEGRLAEPRLSAWGRLGVIVDALDSFATRFPHLFQLMRAGVLRGDDHVLQGLRRRLSRLVEQTLRDGVATGELVDPEPGLTAQYILSFVRSASLYGPRAGRGTRRAHLLGLLERGIRAPRPRARKPGPAKRGAP